MVYFLRHSVYTLRACTLRPSSWYTLVMYDVNCKLVLNLYTAS